MNDDNLMDVDNLPGFKRDMNTGVIHKKEKNKRETRV